MKSADSDGSGKLDFEEFLRLMIFEKKMFFKYFDGADAAGKGWLTEDEVVKAYAAAGHDATGNSFDLISDAHGKGEKDSHIVKIRFKDTKTAETKTTSFVIISEAERAYYAGIFASKSGNDNLINGSELLEIFNHFGTPALGGRACRNAKPAYAARYIRE